MRHVKIILLILLGVAVIVVIVQNHEAMSTTVKFRLNTMFLGRRLLMSPSTKSFFLSFLLGVFVTGVSTILERFHLKRRMRTLTKELEVKDRELNSLRNLPITSDFTQTTQRGE
jgi:hypothetical protein